MTKKVTIFESDLMNKIASLLDAGEMPNDVAKICECNSAEVYRLLRDVRYQDWQRGETLDILHGIGAKTAVKTLIEVAKNVNNSPQARVSASDKLLSYTGYRVTEDGRIDKAPSELTQSELHQRLQALQNEAINRSKPAIIDLEPSHDIDISLDKLLN